MLSLDGPARPPVYDGHRFLSLLSRLRGQSRPRGEGFAVLRWWPNGVHDLFTFASAPGRAQSILERDQRAAQRDPQAPTGWAVVPVSWAQVRDHDHDGCARTDCAGAARIQPVGEQRR